MPVIPSSPLAARIHQLERQVRRQRLALSAVALGAAGVLLAAVAPIPGTITARAIRIVDAEGNPRILIGAPTPNEGRDRKDAQTASLVVLGPDGKDRVILGEEPTPRMDGTSYPRVAAAYGLVLHDRNGSERGAMSYLDNGRGVIALDRPGGDAVEMVTNEESGFAGLTINYANPIGRYAEGWRIGTRGDTAFLSGQDRAQRERVRLAVEGEAPPRFVSAPAAPSEEE